MDESLQGNIVIKKGGFGGFGGLGNLGGFFKKWIHLFYYEKIRIILNIISSIYRFSFRIEYKELLYVKLSKQKKNSIFKFATGPKASEPLL